MLEGLDSAAAGMAAQQQRLDSIANDLANANTVGYKHGRIGFRDLLYDAPGRSSAATVRTGHGAAAVDAGRSFTEGALQRTDRTLDVAVEGQGFLAVRLPDGRDALTRDGNLHVDGLRRLTTSAGALLQPPVTIPAGVDESDISIGPDGTITAGARRVGRLALLDVRSPDRLLSVGDNAFVPTAGSGPVVRAPRATRLTSGALEMSNVDLATAMTDLVDAQRTYELQSKVIQTADSMMQVANEVRK